jgi:hypothetical protein
MVVGVDIGPETVTDRALRRSYVVTMTDAALFAALLMMQR